MNQATVATLITVFTVSSFIFPIRYRITGIHRTIRDANEMIFAIVFIVYSLSKIGSYFFLVERADDDIQNRRNKPAGQGSEEYLNTGVFHQ